MTVPKNRADAAKKAGPTDYDRRDHSKFVAGAGHSFSRIESGRQHETAEAGEEAHDHIHAGNDDAHVQPGEPRRFRVAANRVDLATVTRVTEDDMSEHGKRQEDDHWNRHLAEDPSLADPNEIWFKAADRTTGGEEKRGAPPRGHAAESYHKRRHLKPGDGKAL